MYRCTLDKPITFTRFFGELDDLFLHVKRPRPNMTVVHGDDPHIMFETDDPADVAVIITVYREHQYSKEDIAASQAFLDEMRAKGGPEGNQEVEASVVALINMELS